MRFAFLGCLFVSALILALPAPAQAQAVALHQAAAPSKPAVSAIIPGSPLAALTAAATPPKPQDAAQGAEDAPSPFGTEALGMQVTHLIGDEAAGTVDEFVSAIKKSTTLTPVWQWLASFPSDPVRQRHTADVIKGLSITVLPALAAEAVIRFALQRPRNNLTARAQQIPKTEPAEPTEPEDQGIAAAEAGEIEARSARRETVLAWLRRLFLAVLVLLLNLLPILGFAAAVGVVLGVGLVASKHAHLSVVGVCNVYLVSRVALETLRFLVAPWAPPLRLVAMPDSRALWLNKWLRILLATAGLSYIIVTITEILDMPEAGATAITRIFGLIFNIEIAVMIWHSRNLVGGWIRGKPDSDKKFAASRRRLAAIWHYPALFYILALWVAWAGGVHNAFGVLLRVVVFFFAALLLGRLAWNGSEHLLELIFPDPKARDVRHPNFITRARAYNPLARIVIRIFIGIAMLIVVLLGWGIDILPWLLKDKVSRSLFSAFAGIIVIVIIALLIWEIANGWLDGRTESLASAGKTRQASRLRTLAPILRATFGTVIGLVAGLLCLSRIGVNAAPLLAGAGVLGIAIGFGSQKLVQDIITGLFLLLEDTMQVGDVVTLASMSGTVERLTIRTISLRGGDGSLNIIPFSAVTTVTNQTRDFGYAQVSVGVGYDENIDRVYTVLKDIAHQMRGEATWGSMMRDELQIFGLDQLGASTLTITGQIRTGPGQHWAVRREFNRRMVARFAKEHIEIPYTYLPPAPPFLPAIADEAATKPPSQA